MSRSDDVMDRIGALDAIDLQQLNASAALLRRTDRKYLLSERDAAGVLAAINPAHRCLEIHGTRAFPYTSVYLDTADRRAYREAATRRRRRFKVRYRSHGPGTPWLLEVKRRDGRGSSVKTQLAVSNPASWGLDPIGIAFVDELLERPGLATLLDPVVVTEYQRSTLLDPSATARVTIDRRLAFHRPDEPEAQLRFDNVVTIETKTTGPACEVDRVLWAQGHRPATMSKFGVAVALMEPALPTNKWSRALRHVFVDDPTPS
jgi:hypothetical protein